MKSNFIELSESILGTKKYVFVQCLHISDTVRSVDKKIPEIEFVCYTTY